MRGIEPNCRTTGNSAALASCTRVHVQSGVSADPSRAPCPIRSVASVCRRPRRFAAFRTSCELDLDLTPASACGNSTDLHRFRHIHYTEAVSRLFGAGPHANPNAKQVCGSRLWSVRSEPIGGASPGQFRRPSRFRKALKFLLTPSWAMGS